MSTSNHNNSTNTNSCPQFTSPTPSLTSWNTNGLRITSPYRLSVRLTSLISNIKTLLANGTDFLLLQEVHATDKHHLQILLPNHLIYLSPLSNSKAGVAIIASKNAAKKYTIEQIPNLPYQLRGYVVAISFKLRSNNDDSSSPPPSSLLINIHMPNTQAGRLAQLKCINSSIKPHDYNYAAGDWNFVDHYKDALPYNASTRKLSAKYEKAWSTFISTFSLREFHQPAHTHYGYDGNSSSRIDRIYGTFSEADATLYTPTCSIQDLPNSIKHHLTQKHNNEPPEQDSISDTNHNPIGAPSDHLPIRLTFNPTNPEHLSPNTAYPTDVVYSKEYRERVYHLLAEYQSSPKYKHTVPHRNAVFKLAVNKAIKAMRKEKRNSFTKEDRLLTAIRALKAFNSNNPKLARDILTTHPSIITSNDNNAAVVQRLKQLINAAHTDTDQSSTTAVNNCLKATQFGGSSSNPPPNGTSAMSDCPEHVTTPSITPPQATPKVQRDETKGLHDYLASTKLKSNYLQRISNSLPNTKNRFS